MAKPYSPETKERARRWYANGLGLSEISARLGTSVTTIENWTQDLPRQQPGEWRDVLPAEMRAEALRLARNGMGVAEIARRVGVSYQAAKGWVDTDASREARAGVALPPTERYRIADPVRALALSGAWR